MRPVTVSAPHRLRYYMDTPGFVEFRQLNGFQDVQNGGQCHTPGRRRRSYILTSLGMKVARAEALRLRDAVEIALAEELLVEGEKA